MPKCIVGEGRDDIGRADELLSKRGVYGCCYDHIVVTAGQGCIFCLTCSHPELTEDHVLTSAYVKIFRTVTRNAVNKSV